MPLNTSWSQPIHQTTILITIFSSPLIVLLDFDRVEAEMLKAKSDFAVYERKDIKFREDIKHFKSKEKKLAESIATEKKKLKDKPASIERYNHEISNFEK